MIEYKDYFESFNKEWVEDAYVKNGYNYPVGLERLHLLKNILAKMAQNKLNVLDIGCGDGAISFELLKMGHSVTGIDRSTAMIDMCNSKRQVLPIESQNQVNFICTAFESIPDVLKGSQFDLIIAFGLIGYIDSDELFFQTLSEVSHDGSMLILSWRNALFNFYSGSKYMRTEVESRNVTRLDILSTVLNSEIPGEKHLEFLKTLRDRLNQLDLESLSVPVENVEPSMPEDLVEARQHDHQTLSDIAQQIGWKLENTHTVHPHLLPTKLNKSFPPNVYNTLSDALNVYSDHPISFAWSSVGVGVFRKGRLHE